MARWRIAHAVLVVRGARPGRGRSNVVANAVFMVPAKVEGREADEKRRGEEMTTTLNVRRDGFGIELRRGTFHVLLDGNEIGSIEWKHFDEWTIEPGQHTLQVKSGRYSSQCRSFRAANGEVVSFNCSGARIWPLFVASFVKPNIAISLRRE